MFVGTMHNSEDTCITMSLHVRRLNASLHGMPRERDRTTGVDTCVGTAEGVPSPVEPNKPQSDTQGACRAVNHWTTNGNWHTCN